MRLGFAALGVSAEDFMTPQAMVQLGYPPARIDLLTSIDGVTFDECFAHRLDVTIGRTLLPVISVDDLIRNKLATGRAKTYLMWNRCARMSDFCDDGLNTPPQFR